MKTPRPLKATLGKFSVAVMLMTHSAIAMTTSQSGASPLSGGSDRGGGDPCQNRIEEIRNDIETWISEGWNSTLDFTGTSTNLRDYNDQMTAEIALTRLDNQGSISCSDDQNDVMVDGVPKVCRAYHLSPTQPRIVCFRGETPKGDGHYVNGFMGLSEDDQYFQIHHEFAVLGSIEDQSGALTNYPLSNQISKYLKNVVVKKLGVKGDSGAAPAPQFDKQAAILFLKDVSSNAYNQIYANACGSQSEVLTGWYGSAGATYSTPSTCVSVPVQAYVEQAKRVLGEDDPFTQSLEHLFDGFSQYGAMYPNDAIVRSVLELSKLAKARAKEIEKQK